MAELMGKYILDKRIGSGGMGDVFLARGPLGPCVIKRPHAHLTANPDFLRMFLDEAKLVAQLNHPNIATLYDLGSENGLYYLALEYVPGFDLMTISLEHERKGEWIPAEVVAKLMSEVAAALHYAHDAVDTAGKPLQIIHRDVSPHNIMLSTSGDVKVIDFGVAKAASKHHRTQAGLVKGKYAYMAPEQVLGLAIDRRVDVYAMGLVMYELLANQRAIAGDLEVDQITNARDSNIKPIEQIRPNLTEPLKLILRSCLQPNPNDRYPTADALRADLEKYLAYERHVVGRDDLIRLFRVVAAEVTHLEAPPTEKAPALARGGDTIAPMHPTEPSIPNVTIRLSATGERKLITDMRGATTSNVGAIELSPATINLAKVEDITAPELNGPNPYQPAVQRSATAPDDALPSNPLPKRAAIGAAAIGLLGLGLWGAFALDSPAPTDKPLAPTTELPPAPRTPEPPVVPPPPVAPVPVVDAPPPPPPAVAKARLIAEAKVPDVEVLIDGLSRGMAPQTLELEPGTVTLTFRRARPRAQRTETLKLASGASVSRTWTPGVGELFVQIEPFGTVSVDGVLRTNAKGISSVTIPNVFEGPHRLTVENQQLGKRVTFDVKVEPGKTTEPPKVRFP